MAQAIFCHHTTIYSFLHSDTQLTIHIASTQMSSWIELESGRPCCVNFTQGLTCIVCLPRDNIGLVSLGWELMCGVYLIPLFNLLVHIHTTTVFLDIQTCIKTVMYTPHAFSKVEMPESISYHQRQPSPVENKLS